MKKVLNLKVLRDIPKNIKMEIQQTVRNKVKSCKTCNKR